jgi:PST family polysaccharide transporter
VYLLLGPKWSGAIAPFRVLALGLLFRTSYKMSDSISRATGAVYRRAWRQGVYALLVIGGAWVGQHWGVEYVAVGVVGALVINFLLMAQLSLSVSGLTWGGFFAAHLAALRLAAASGIVAWSVITPLRRWDLPAAARLGIAGSIALLIIALLIWRLPRPFLGGDGRWMMEVLRGYLPNRLQPPRLDESRPAARASTTPGAPNVGPA